MLPPILAAAENVGTRAQRGITPRLSSVTEPSTTMVFDTEIETLKAAHRALDERIRQLELERSAGQLEVQRLKKRKLQLRDRITRLESSRLPDIIA